MQGLPSLSAFNMPKARQNQTKNLQKLQLLDKFEQHLQGC